MNTMTLKEKPDLLFNNPHKQKIYLFLKHNPGKDFETFQVLTGDQSATRPQFKEVEQAILAREGRERSKGAMKEAAALFLNGSPSLDSKPAAGAVPAKEKEAKLKKADKKKMNERAKQFIIGRPECTYEELVQGLGFRELSKPHFFSMKTQLRKKGVIPTESRTRRGWRGERKTVTVLAAPVAPVNPTKTIEILESIDASGFSDEFKEHYKRNVLALLQKHLPNGKSLQMVFLSDPPTIELRRSLH